jgi:hypothetical protein
VAVAVDLAIVLATWAEAVVLAVIDKVQDSLLLLALLTQLQ